MANFSKQGEGVDWIFKKNLLELHTVICQEMYQGTTDHLTFQTSFTSFIERNCGFTGPPPKTTGHGEGEEMTHSSCITKKRSN